MASKLGRQLMAGALAGALLSGCAWLLSSGRRAGLAELKAANDGLDAKVQEDARSKASCEALENEVGEREGRIAEMLALLSTEGERTGAAHAVQKLAGASGLGQALSWSADRPIKHEHYTEYPTMYKYSGGFHEFGRFLSLVSGFEKIVNVSDIVMARDAGRATGTAAIEFRLSVYAHDPDLKPKAPAGGNEDPT
jgi:type IV pilus assembly protein PilO